MIKEERKTLIRIIDDSDQTTCIFSFVLDSSNLETQCEIPISSHKN